MKVEAVHEHGRLRFLQPVSLRYEKIRVLEKIPEDAIDRQDPYAGLDSRSRALVAALDEIRNTAIPESDGDDTSSEAAKRLAAFALRKDV